MSALDILEEVWGNPEADIVFTGDKVGEFADMMVDWRPIFGRKPLSEDELAGIAKIKSAIRIIGRKSPEGANFGKALSRHWSIEYPTQ